MTVSISSNETAMIGPAARKAAKNHQDGAAAVADARLLSPCSLAEATPSEAPTIRSPEARTRLKAPRAARSGRSENVRLCR